MPTAFTEPVAPPKPESPRRKKWTRAECEFLGTVGFWENTHFELIDGELIDKMPKKRPHVLIVLRIHVWLTYVFNMWRVQKEDPIDVAPEDNPASEPEPDLVVLCESSEHYKANPTP